MTLHDRLRQLASALPSDDSAVTITRADLVALLERDSRETEVGSTRDLTVEEVADETSRAPSTVRGWLMSGALRGYKFNNRDWRVPRAALSKTPGATSRRPQLVRRITRTSIATKRARTASPTAARTSCVPRTGIGSPT